MIEKARPAGRLGWVALALLVLALPSLAADGRVLSMVTGSSKRALPAWFDEANRPRLPSRVCPIAGRALIMTGRTTLTRHITALKAVIEAAENGFPHTAAQHASEGDAARQTTEHQDIK